MGINIRLDENWKLRSDTNQYFLIRIVNGREINDSYHGKIESALQTYLDKSVRGCNAKTFAEVVLLVKTLKKTLNNALQPLNLKLEGDGGGK